MEENINCGYCNYEMEEMDKCECCGRYYCEYCGVQGDHICRNCEEMEED